VTVKKSLVPFEGLVDAINVSGVRIQAEIHGTWRGAIAEERHGWLQAKLLELGREVFATLVDVGDLKRRPRSVLSTFEQRVDDVLAADGLKGQIRDVGFRLASPVTHAVAPAPLPPPAPTAVVAPPPPAIPATDQTALAIPIIAGPALPFQPGPARPPPPVGPSVQSGETAFVPVIEALDDLPDLTVEQYASLCVERVMRPGAEAQVAQRYRVLTQEALQALDARWSRRFQTEGELHRRWQQAYAQYEAWVRSQKR
jgi:hypothetical protein